MIEEFNSGSYFIAYVGHDYTRDEICEGFEKVIPRCDNSILRSEYNYKIKKECNVGITFVKLVYPKNFDENTDLREPYWNDNTGILTVSGFHNEEMSGVFEGYNIEDLYDVEDNPMLYHRTINHLYDKFRNRLFEVLYEEDLHICSCIYDNDSATFICGVTEPDNEYTHLYYGYTSKNNELMFSNCEDILKEFCNSVYEMPNNTYMYDGEMYSVYGKKFNLKVVEDARIKYRKDSNTDIIDEPNNDNNNLVKKNKKFSSNTPFIENNKENSDLLFGGLNKILADITDEVVRSKVERIVEEYLVCEDSKEKINEILNKELSDETRVQALKIVKNAIELHNIKNVINDELEEALNEKLKEYTSRVQVPVVNVIKLNDVTLGQTSGGFYHNKYEEVLGLVSLDEPVMLIGPAGSGKNHAVGQISKSLSLPMYYTNNASNEFKLTGFIDAGGNYRDTEFYKAFKNGGIFFLDEIDNSDPSALIVINSALANGYMAFPHETIDKHPNFRMVAAANTWGKGSDLQYVGRNALDAATLDRFDNVFFDYDKKLEECLYPSEQILEFMWALRGAVEETKIPHIVSTRGIGKMYKKELNNIDTETILRVNVIRNLGQDDLNTLLGNMPNINHDNKYYACCKKLKLDK